MPISKDCISPPLEAGTSILGMKQLPPQLTSALDYVSNRLARKGLHLSMIVVRKDLNLLPTPFSPQQSPNRAPSPSHSITTSPARSLFNSASSTITKSLSKHSSTSCLSDSTSSTTSSSPSFSKSKWSGFPSSPAPQSPLLNRPTSPTTMNPYGITLMQTTALTSKAEKTLRRIIFKAEKRLSIGSGWLSSQPLTSLPVCPHTLDLLSHTIAQNDILFTQEALTLLTLDHLYMFKSALHTYSRTLSPIDLTTSVDSLRCLILSCKGDKLKKSELIKRYQWLGVSLAALVDVNEAYKTAYGGNMREGGVEMGFEERSQQSPSLRFQKLPKLGLKTDFGVNELRMMRFNVGGGGSLKSSSSSANSSDESSSISSKFQADSGAESPMDKEVEVGESAKGRDSWGMRLNGTEDRGPHMRGPVTPNGFEDITPVTKGEWCFLMVGEGWRSGRRGAVETC